MIHPLDGARLKVGRAQEHLDSLKRELQAYLDQDPYKVGVKEDGRSHTAFAEVRIEPPLHLAMIVGDCVTNARAALDYIAWELAVHYLGDPPFDPVADRRWVSFPLTINPHDTGYVNKINRFTNRRIPTDVIANIKMVQPHNAGYESLWILHELVNTDKHRVPLLTIGIVNPSMRSLTMVIADVLSGELNTFEATSVTSVTAFPFPFDTIEVRDVKVDAQGIVSGFVAFQDVSMPREPIDGTLERVIRTVADVIQRFDKLI